MVRPSPFHQPPRPLPSSSPFLPTRPAAAVLAAPVIPLLALYPQPCGRVRGTAQPGAPSPPALDPPPPPHQGACGSA
ncbi:hypothetical protein ACP4OV_005447 [Aristida adscensionis]